MRAQNFYTTGVKALEDQRALFYLERDEMDTESNHLR